MKNSLIFSIIFTLFLGLQQKGHAEFVPAEPGLDWFINLLHSGEYTSAEKADTMPLIEPSYFGQFSVEEFEAARKVMLDSLEAANSDVTKSDWLFILGFTARRRRELASGINYFERRLEVVKKINDTIKILNSYAHLDWLYGAFDMKDEGLKYAKKRMDIALLYKDTFYIGEAASSLGWTLTNVAFQKQDKSLQDSAVKYLEIAYRYRIKDKLNTHLERTITYCMALSRANKRENAIAIAKEALNDETGKESVFYPRFLKQIGNYYAYLNNRDSAFHYFNRMIEVENVRSKESNEFTYVMLKDGRYVDVMSLLNMIQAHMSFNEYKQAANQIDIILYKDYPKTNKHLIAYYQQLGARAYYEIGEFQKSADCYSAFSAFNDTLREQEYQKYLEANKAHSEVQIAMEKERALLEKQQQQLLAKEQEEKQRLITTFFSGGLLLLVLFLGVMYNRFRITKKQKGLIEKQNSLLDDKNKELKEQKEGVEKVVEERTRELSEQKKQIEKTYNDAELLHEIGKDITSYLSVSKINKAVYEKVNKLMKADGFGIGIADEKEGKLFFPGYIEKGVIYDEETSYDINNMDRLACVCYNKQTEILISDIENELQLYTSKYEAPVVGEDPRSVIYAPIVLKDKKIGVITVQSFDKNAFSNYHMNMIKSIATHTAIALDNAQLYESLEEKVIERTKQVVEQKQEIIDSINYAKRIQDAILPSKKMLDEHLEKHFILYKPKDIVAGDFYWLETIKDSIYFAAADCTGHGVPGAMVSVVCSNALSKALIEENITDPGKLLGRVRELVIERFGRSDSEIKDGMDVSLCAYNKKKRTIEWAGANNPLWIIRKKESVLEEIKPDKQPVGKYDVEKPFTTHKVQLEKGDSIYLFSDGYQDQFGGPRGKKFKARALKELITSMQEKDMQQQHLQLDDEFEKWKGDLEQIDDVCVIGVKI